MPIDTDQLQSLISILGKETLVRVRQSYLEDSEPKLAQLKQAVETNQLASVEQLSHSLKSASANMALSDLAKCFADMEHQAAQSHSDQLMTLYIKAESCYGQSVTALKEFF
ncbi:Hpt domain-containing protein [Rhodanobacter aciditrophus]|uniref:Hpt domain-containing protein n=1 Tax=Rhodanobacter aciditrophus TaxID=1623218 RepID=A0ABW4B074_9GAMM